MAPVFFERRIILKESGFTLIEVMVALVIFLIAIIGCYSLQISSSFSNARSYSVAAASTWAQFMAEDLLARQYASYYTDPLLVNSKGSSNGLTNINDCTTGSPDGVRYVHADGSIDTIAASSIYTTCWNIVDDRPMKHIKQIHIIVIKNTGLNAGQLYTQDYFKLGPL